MYEYLKEEKYVAETHKLWKKHKRKVDWIRFIMSVLRPESCFPREVKYFKEKKVEFREKKRRRMCQKLTITPLSNELNLIYFREREKEIRL